MDIQNKLAKHIYIPINALSVNSCLPACVVAADDLVHIAQIWNLETNNFEIVILACLVD